MKQFRVITFLRNNSVLLFVVLFTVFIIPLFPQTQRALLYNIGYSFIFLLSIFSLERRSRLLTSGAIVAFIFVWIAQFFQLPQLGGLASFITMIFFTLVVIKLVAQIVRSQTVTPSVIFEAINGYLLIGLMFSLFVSLILKFNPDAFAVTNVTEEILPNVVYYTFVTLTTLGYGDIVPISAPAKSLAMFISISGQMYVAILMALLVGKYLSNNKQL